MHINSSISGGICSVSVLIVVNFGANIGSLLIAMRRGGIMCEGIVKKSILVSTRGLSVIQTHHVIDNLRKSGNQLDVFEEILHLVEHL